MQIDPKRLAISPADLFIYFNSTVQREKKKATHTHKKKKAMACNLLRNIADICISSFTPINEGEKRGKVEARTHVLTCIPAIHMRSCTTLDQYELTYVCIVIQTQIQWPPT